MVHRAALAIGACLMASAALAQGGWHTVTIDNVATVEMPGEAQYENTSNSGRTEHRYVVLLPGPRRYAVLAGLHTTSGSVDVEGTMRNQLNAEAAENQGGKWKSVRWTTHYEALAVEATGITRQGYAIRIFNVLKDRRYIRLRYQGPVGTEAELEADLFVKSLLPMSRDYWVR